MALLHTRNFSAYARKMLIYGYVVHIDTTDIRAQTAELQKIGVNVNQIARRLNSMGPLYTQDVADIKGAVSYTHLETTNTITPESESCSISLLTRTIES